MKLGVYSASDMISVPQTNLNSSLVDIERMMKESHYQGMIPGAFMYEFNGAYAIELFCQRIEGRSLHSLAVTVRETALKILSPSFRAQYVVDLE